MRPLPDSRYKVLWGVVALLFAAAEVWAFSAGFVAEAVTGAVVIVLLSVLSLKKQYKSKAGALAALATLGMAVMGYFAGLSVEVFHAPLAEAAGNNISENMVLGGFCLQGTLIIAVLVILEVMEIRRETNRLKEEGRIRRRNPVFLVASTLLIAGGLGMLVYGIYFGAVWLLLFGLSRGLLEVAA